MRLAFAIIVGLALAGPTHATDLVVYDEAFRNGFTGDYSYGGGSDFASTTVAHGGTHSVAFTGNDFKRGLVHQSRSGVRGVGVSVLHFWIHGGTTGGQQLEIFVCTDESASSCADAPLDGFIAGGAIAANQWREVTVPLGAPPLSLGGSFGRIDLQNQVTPGVQPTLYIDDMSLVAAGGGGPDAIFADGFDTPQAANLLVDEHDVTAGGMTSDRFTWRDRVRTCARRRARAQRYGRGSWRHARRRASRIPLRNGRRHAYRARVVKRCRGFRLRRLASDQRGHLHTRARRHVDARSLARGHVDARVRRPPPCDLPLPYDVSALLHDERAGGRVRRAGRDRLAVRDGARPSALGCHMGSLRSSGQCARRRLARTVR